MSSTGAEHTAARKRSGAWGMQAPTRMPPLLPPLDPQGRSRAVPVVLKVYGRGQEVVEHVLLRLPHAAPVPGLAVLAAAPILAMAYTPPASTQATAALR